MRTTELPGPVFLGIEGGGTRTVALLADAEGRLLKRFESGPANFKLLTEAQFLRRLREVRAAFKGFSQPAAVAIGLAGARGEPEWQRIRAAAAQVWAGVPCHATHDLETALAAGEPRQKAKGKRQKKGAPPPATATLDSQLSTQVLVLSGTGSCFYGRHPDGRAARFGGWGHILGDKGSGYEIGLRALKACVFYLDRDGEWSRLGRRILRVLQLNEPGDLIPWAQAASKADIAALAKEVFAAAAERDAIAKDILEGAAASLAKDGVACAKKLAKPGEPVRFVLAGSVLLQQPKFARAVANNLAGRWPGCVVTPLKRESAWGAVELARGSAGFSPLQLASTIDSDGKKRSELRGLNRPEGRTPLSPTEQRNPRSMSLDKLPLTDAIELMLSEDAKLPAAIRREAAKIERVIGKIVAAFKRGGRLFYVGAGTSGRLGILDASECPPTFRTDPELVQGIIAGGQAAVFRAVEGAEDDCDAGGRAVQFRGVSKHDVVVGIAASGRTPFVHSALAEARARGAFTALLCFNPAMARQRGVAHVVIAPDIGSEILTGSTRLKSGTATKLVLNMFTTLAMVRTGKVISNLMVDLNPSNVKLRDRAVRIVRELTGTDYETAKAALAKEGWVVKAAWKRLAGATKRKA